MTDFFKNWLDSNFLNTYSSKQRATTTLIMPVINYFRASNSERIRQRNKFFSQVALISCIKIDFFCFSHKHVLSLSRSLTSRTTIDLVCSFCYCYPVGRQQAKHHGQDYEYHLTEGRCALDFLLSTCSTRMVLTSIACFLLFGRLT